jgi:hypothetical protein
MSTLKKNWEINSQQIEALRKSGRLDKYLTYKESGQEIIENSFVLINGTVYKDAWDDFVRFQMIKRPMVYNTPEDHHEIELNRTVHEIIFYYACKEHNLITKHELPDTNMYTIYYTDPGVMTQLGEKRITILDLLLDMEHIPVFKRVSK